MGRFTTLPVYASTAKLRPRESATLAISPLAKRVAGDRQPAGLGRRCSPVMLATLLQRLRRSTEATTVLVFSGLQVVLTLVSNRVLTELVPPAHLGEFYLLMNVVMWITLPTASGFIYVWRHWAHAVETGTEQTLFGFLRRAVGIQILFAIVVACVMRAAGWVVPSWRSAVFLVAACVGQAVGQAFDQVQTLKRRRVTAGILALIATPLRQLVLGVSAAAFVLDNGVDILGAQAAYVTVAAGLSYFLTARLVPKASEPTADAPFVSAPTFLRFAAPFFFAGAATQVAASAERWGLALRADPGAAAVYVQALGLASAAAGAITNPIGNFFSPLIASGGAKTPENPLVGARSALKRYLVAMLVVLIGEALFVAIFARLLAGLFFGAKYSATATLLPWVAVAQAAFAFAVALAMVPLVAGRTVSVNIATTTARLAFVALVVFGPSLGRADQTFAIYLMVAQCAYLLLMLWIALAAFRESSRRAGAGDAKVSPQNSV